MIDYLKILEKFKGQSAGIFVDEANLFYSQKTLGWHINWQKVLELFKQFYNIKMARYYMGMPLKKDAYERNVLIKNRLKKDGFEVISKALKKIYLDNQKKEFKYKCNFSYFLKTLEKRLSIFNKLKAPKINSG